MLVLDVIRLVVAYASYLVVLSISLLAGYRLLLHPLRKYPGPFLAKLTQYHAQYGPIVRVGPNRLIFNTVEAQRDIYQNERFKKAQTYLVSTRNNIFNVFTAIDKDLHRQKRQVVGQAVSERSMRAFEPTMVDKIEVCLRQILEQSRASVPADETKKSVPVDMTEKSRYLGLDIVGQLAFGYDLRTLSDEQNRFITKAMAFGNYRGNVLQHIPWLSNLYIDNIANKVFYEAREKYFRLLDKMISTRMAQDKHAQQDFYSFVADSVKGTNRGGDFWLEALFFLVAGGDTTATAICAAFFYLSRSPECYSKLASEIRSTFPSGREIKGGPQLAGCRYLRACVDEALRMSPPISTTLWREQDQKDDSSEPLIVDGQVIPRGTIVGINIYALNHNERYFPDPFVYRPERWIPADTADTPESNLSRKLMYEAFTPFSVGPRGCAGKAMAYMEVSLIVAKSLWYFDFKAAPGKLGEIGGGNASMTDGRGRINEYQLYDIFTSRHEGPHLIFSPRGNLCSELETAA
ncbi:cytochrome P450 [Hypoxylon sp. FL1150]|nr:cytochrome P450 [Hypoxylon sp. FL1150]